MAQSKTTITGVLTVGIPVVDQDRALAFYVDTLGFETRRDAAVGPGMRWIEVAPPGAAITVALAQARDGVPAGVETGLRLATSDVDGAHADLRARGVHVDEVLRWPGIPPMFALRDQDDNGLTIVEER
jgi:catechol 2,3-dioxygenase-like lactoylglutathione lyase family enzyme